MKSKTPVQKNLWIINEYAGSPKHGMTLRHFYLAKEFENNNWHTTTISASFSHLLDEYPILPANQNYLKETIQDLDFVWIKVFKYKSSTHYKRILKWFYFTFRLFFVDKWINNKPDFILCSPTAPFCIIAAYYLKRKYKAKLIFEVRDIWPLSLVNVGNFSSYHPFILFMKQFEKFAIKQSDFLVSNLQFYKNYLLEQKLFKKTSWISNAIYLKEKEDYQVLPAEIKNQIPKNKFIVGYTGKLGKSNAMSFFIEAARLVQKKDIHFVIVGQGEEKENLVALARNLENITFIPQIPKNQIQGMLSLFDVCYIGWNKENIYNYGVSPNKIFDYMYAAKPIIHSIQLENEIVSLSKSGLTIPEESPFEIAHAINQIYLMEENKRKELGVNGKKYVVKHFTYDQLAKKYISILTSK